VLCFIVLGMIFITTGTIWCVIVAIFSSSLGNHLRGSEKTAGPLRRINGVLFALLGLKLATSQIS
jgi:threonine/homoserine/homoserine lactone efflux protein